MKKINLVIFVSVFLFILSCKEKTQKSESNRIPNSSVEERIVNGKTLYFSNDKKLDGIFELHNGNGKYFEKITFEEGIKSGLYQSFDGNGYLGSEGIYRDGKKNGTFKSYWLNSNGLMFKIHYKDGKKEGIDESFYENGQVWTRELYSNDKLNGLSETFLQDGKIEFKHIYKNNELISLETYNDKGILKSFTQYIDGIQNESRGYDVYGELILKVIHTNGSDGSFETYHENGKIEYKGIVKNGKRDGIMEVYDENGEYEGEVIYKNGELIN